MRGFSFVRILLILLGCNLCLFPVLVFGGGTVLFSEPFEDSNYSGRGWYDSSGGALSSTEHVEGSTKSFECRFMQSQAGCAGGTPGRHLFAETETLYVRYNVKYSANYTGSNLSYWPHEINLLTNKNGQWTGPAYTHFTAYIEQNEGEPVLSIQDGQNIDETRVGVNLTGITEARAVAGCNGDSDGYGVGTCYSVGSIHYNGKSWKAGAVYFQDTPGPYYKNDWHLVEVYFKMNSIVAGKGVPDGIIRYWYDGKLIMDHSNVLLRTGQYPDMKFNQFLLGPYIGSSPVDQTFWIDNLVVATERQTALLPPSGLRIVSN